jgi:ribonuclease VapC
VSSVALDSSALIALLNAEPGGDLVRSVLAEAAVSTVNLAEVTTKLVDWRIDLEDLSAVVREGKVEIVPFTETQARLCGELRRATKSRGLSLGDRACLALAQQRGLTAVTADAAWVGATSVPLLLIRPQKL